MFTGIIESMGKVVSIKKEKGNVHFTIETPIAKELKIDQSLAHDGVCLTVIDVNPENSQYTVTAIQETLNKSNMKLLKVNDYVNLERSIKADGRLDGHFVLGHVDQTAICTSISETNGSWYYVFEYDPKEGNYTVDKGSISVNGVSLTIVEAKENSFSVAIIPYTYLKTNFRYMELGSIVNLEFDIVGKYIAKLFKLYST